MFDFTNESNMDSVLVKYEITETGLSVVFFNQEFKQIKNVAVIL